MATTTATILIGRAHQNDSGINPTHFIQFTENDRPALILQAIEGKETSEFSTANEFASVDSPSFEVVSFKYERREDKKSK